MPDMNYFTCTLGEAALLSKDRDFKNINDLIEQQAGRIPDLPAVGFFAPGNDNHNSWSSHVLSFSDIRRGSHVVAGLLSGITPRETRQTVALLCPSTVNFLLIWLGLVRLRHPVLLLAPQCSPSAVAHLCKTCEVGQFYYDELYEDLVIKSSNASPMSRSNPLGFTSIQSLFSTSIYQVIDQELKGHSAREEVLEEDIAYLHHTSGTSSGLPKPVPQTHRAGLCVLPTLDGRHQATLTTTPLYHGGIADLFRAWTSDAMIWLFPDKEVPITPKNIIHCLEIAQESHRNQNTPQVRYFSSVPYILQMMAADETSLSMLQSMDTVGVGGAALPAEIGDKLVEQNVHLISRFGSAECGFLMSSQRDYFNDKHWQFLRLDDHVRSLSFEQRDGALSELIVLPGWPHMAKTNREDGSYATADLFEPHPITKNAWRYHSRADSQLTLITGKKFDPAPLEAAIATSNLLKDVLIFGNGEPYPGALLFRSKGAEEFTDEDLLNALEPMIRNINIDSQSHVRLAQNMLVPMPYLPESFEKSSKGTIIRKKAEERYATVIEQAYTRVTLSVGDIEDDDILSAIKKVVGSVVGREDNLVGETDLFTYGVDSLACVQIRHALIQLLPETSRDLSLTVVEDCGNIDKLAEMLISRRHGRDYNKEDQQQIMLDLVKKYSDFSDQPKIKDRGLSATAYDGTEKPPSQIILLTGATGALGAHILHYYLNSHNIGRIFCLVRGASNHAATERVRNALSSRKLSSLTPLVTILCSDLSLPTLGLDGMTYKMLASTVTTIHHIAWAVNFRLSVSSFSNNLASLQNLINLALASPHAPPSFIFCSSVASMANFPVGQKVLETISMRISDCSPLGYSRSKWVAEAICHIAHEQTRLNGKIAVMRVGQLSGATDTGIWSMREAYPMMLSQASLTKTLPDLNDVSLSWLPIDIAARSLVQAADHMVTRKKGGEIQVYHIVNADHDTRWNNIVRMVKKYLPDLRVLSPKHFVEMLEELQKQGIDHPAMRLIPHWKAEYEDAGNIRAERANAEEKQGREFAMEKTLEVAPVLRNARPVDEQYFDLMWKWVQEQDFSVDDIP